MANGFVLSAYGFGRACCLRLEQCSRRHRAAIVLQLTLFQHPRYAHCRMRVLNSEQMREADRRTIEDIGIPSIVLMENAGRQAVAAMEAAFDNLSSSRVGVLCGRGNNGGDGFVVARTLLQRGIDAAVFLLGSVAEVRGDARINLEVLGRVGLTVVEITTAQDWELHFTQVAECDVLVDAMLGTGMHGPLSGLLETVVADVNELGVP